MFTVSTPVAIAYNSTRLASLGITTSGSATTGIVGTTGTPQTTTVLLSDGTVPDTVESVVTVTNPNTGQVYTLAEDTDNPGATEFVVNENGQVVIDGVAAENVVAQTIESESEISGFPYEPIPDFLKNLGLVEGFSIVRSFANHPKIDGIQIIRSGEVSAYDLGLYNGREVSLFGINWFVDGIETNVTYQGYNVIVTEIAFNLIGQHAPRGDTLKSPLDRPQRIKPLSRNNQLKLSDLLPYSGDSVTIPVAESVSSTDTMSFRSVFENYAVSKQSFPYYSGSVPAYKRWGSTTLHYLRDSDIISDAIAFQHTGHGYRLNGVQLTKEYENVEWQPDNQNDPDAEVAANETIKLVTGNPDPTSPFAPGEVVNNSKFGVQMSLCFDNGGQTKEEITTWSTNGQTIKKVTKKYGFKFTSKEFYKVQIIYPPDDETNGKLSYTDFFGNVLTYLVYKRSEFGLGANVTSTQWTQIEEQTEDYIYDEKTGYLDRIETSGWRTMRYKSESGSEGITIEGELLVIERALNASDGGGIRPTKESLEAFYAAKKKERDLYLNFFKQPINDVTKYYLKPLRDCYDDIPEIDDDSDEPEPKFCYLQVREENSFVSTPDPYSTADDPKPPLTAGKRFKEEVATYPIVPYNRRSLARKPEVYETTKQTENQEGEGMKNSLKIGEFDQSAGRPSVHTRLVLNKENDGVTVGGTTKASLDYLYLLRSVGASGSANDPPNSSISFPGVVSPAEGRRCAEVALSIENTLNAETITIQVFPRFNFKEGDRVLYRNRYYLVIDIKKDPQIERLGDTPVLLTSAIEVKLGRMLSPSVTMITRRKEKED